MSSNHKKMLKSLQKREELFRKNHPEFALGDGHNTIVSKEHDEDADSSAISIRVPPLHRQSCQLVANAHGELLRLYPLGTPDGRSDLAQAKAGARSTRESFEKKNKIQILKQAPNKKSRTKRSFVKRHMEEYDASKDVAVMLRDIEAATHASGKKVGNFKNSTKVPPTHDAGSRQEATARELSDQTHDDEKIGGVPRSVPSLYDLTQTSVAEAILPNLKELENTFIDRMCQAHAEAKKSYNYILAEVQIEANGLSTGPETKKAERLSSEIEMLEARLKKLRAKLVRANEAVDSRKEEITEMFEDETDRVQEDFDRERVKIAQKYIEEREKLEDEFSRSYFGLKICKRCASPFKPKERMSLPGWERCSVIGCDSANHYCLDCCSNPCPRCYAPICSAHEAPHEFECAGKLPCGYHYKTGDVFCARSAGCCGGTSSKRCFECMIQVCDTCRVQTKCPRCELQDRHRRDNALPPIRMPWGSAEYEKKRRLLNFPTNWDDAIKYQQSRMKGAYHSINRTGAWNYFLDTTAPMEGVLKRIDAKNELEKKRKHDEEVKDSFDHFKRRRLSSSTKKDLPIHRREKCEVIHNVSIPRVFISDPNSTFGLFLFENMAAQHGKAAIHVANHFTADSSAESPLKENDLIIAVNEQTIFDQSTHFSLSRVESLIRKTLPGKSLNLSIIRYEEFQHEEDLQSDEEIQDEEELQGEVLW